MPGDADSIPGDMIKAYWLTKEVMPGDTVSVPGNAVSAPDDVVSIPGDTVPGDLDMDSAIVLSPSVPKLLLCCPSGWRGVLLAEGMSWGSLALDPSARLGSSLRSGTCTQRVQWVHDCTQDTCLRHRGNKSTLRHVQCDTPQEKFPAASG